MINIGAANIVENITSKISIVSPFLAILLFKILKDSKLSLTWLFKVLASSESTPEIESVSVSEKTLDCLGVNITHTMWARPVKTDATISNGRV